MTCLILILLNRQVDIVVNDRRWSFGARFIYKIFIFRGKFLKSLSDRCVQQEGTTSPKTHKVNKDYYCIWDGPSLEEILHFNSKYLSNTLNDTLLISFNLNPFRHVHKNGQTRKTAWYIESSLLFLVFTLSLTEALDMSHVNVTIYLIWNIYSLIRLVKEIY